MDYLNQIKTFWSVSDPLDLSATDIATYLSLVDYSDSIGKNPFICHWDIICQKSKTSKNTYYKSMEKLKSFGFIEITKGYKNTIKPRVFILKLKNRKGTEREQKIISAELPSKEIKFSSIPDFKAFYTKFTGNKDYLFLAYKFWTLWEGTNPGSKTMRDATVYTWYEATRKIFEVDEQKVERILAIYLYFSKCAEEQSGYDDFWFKTIKSVAAFRKKDKSGVYYLDKMATIVQDKINSDEGFKKELLGLIQKFKK